MEEVIIRRKTEVIDFGREWRGSDFMAGIRVYRSSPSGATLQIRHHGPTTESGAGVARHVLATAQYVTKAELAQLITSMQIIHDQLQPERATP